MDASSRGLPRSGLRATGVQRCSGRPGRVSLAEVFLLVPPSSFPRNGRAGITAPHTNRQP